MTKLHSLQTKTHHHHHTHEHEEAEDEYHEIITKAHIFDARDLQEEIPATYDAVRITLDGSIKADLDWSTVEKAALKYKEQGLRIFWEIDLGLFDRLPHPLGHQSQFLSLVLSLEHFRDTLWKQFRAETIGLCIYRGSVDSSHNYRWDEEQCLNLKGWIQDNFENIQRFIQENELDIDSIHSLEEITPQILMQNPCGRRLLALFCRDATAEYMHLLVSNMPDALKYFALFDTTSIQDSMFVSQLITKEKYPRISIGVKGSEQFESELGWESPLQSLGGIGREMLPVKNNQKATIGICLPAMNEYSYKSIKNLHPAISALKAQDKSFRFISETHLTTEWDGLDYLIVDSDNIETKARRKLLGFCAAGGTVVNVGKDLQLPEEMSFSAFSQ